LAEGAKATFDIVPNRGKESAENLRIASDLQLVSLIDFSEDAGISGAWGREKRPGLDRLPKWACRLTLIH
jgi:hypothetical protein